MKGGWEGGDAQGPWTVSWRKNQLRVMSGAVTTSLSLQHPPPATSILTPPPLSSFRYPTMPSNTPLLLRILQVLRPPSDILQFQVTLHSCIRYSKYYVLLQIPRNAKSLSTPPDTSSTTSSFRYSEYYLLQIFRVLRPPSDTPSTTSSFRYSKYHFLLQILRAPPPPSDTPPAIELQPTYLGRQRVRS